jgi:hypothetical protein
LTSVVPTTNHYLLDRIAERYFQEERDREIRKRIKDLGGSKKRILPQSPQNTGDQHLGPIIYNNYFYCLK